MTVARGSVPPGPAGRRWRVLIVDDAPSVRALVRHALGSDFEVTEAANVDSGIERAAAIEPDVVLLDVRMPGRSGIEAFDDLRSMTSAPVLFLTGNTSEVDRVRGLDLGADDYITKPFSTLELAARVRAAIRRSLPPPAVEAIRFGDRCLDPVAREVTRADEVIPLPAREMDLLITLATKPRKTFSRSELLRQVWGSREDWQNPATVTEHIRRLRVRLEDRPEQPRWIVTVRGAGYRFDP